MRGVIRYISINVDSAYSALYTNRLFEERYLFLMLGYKNFMTQHLIYGPNQNLITFPIYNLSVNRKMTKFWRVALQLLLFFILMLLNFK